MDIRQGGGEGTNVQPVPGWGNVTDQFVTRRTVRRACVSIP